MISLRTALCLSGLLVIATGSAALDTGADPQNESVMRPASGALAGEAMETTGLTPAGSQRELGAESAPASEAEEKLLPAR